MYECINKPLQRYIIWTKSNPQYRQAQEFLLNQLARSFFLVCKLAQRTVIFYHPSKRSKSICLISRKYVSVKWRLHFVYHLSHNVFATHSFKTLGEERWFSWISVDIISYVLSSKPFPLKLKKRKNVSMDVPAL